MMLPSVRVRGFYEGHASTRQVCRRYSVDSTQKHELGLRVNALCSPLSHVTDKNQSGRERVSASSSVEILLITINETLTCVQHVCMNHTECFIYRLM